MDFFLPNPRREHRDQPFKVWPVENTTPPFLRGRLLEGRHGTRGRSGDCDQQSSKALDNEDEGGQIKGAMHMYFEHGTDAGWTGLECARSAPTTVVAHSRQFDSCP